MKNKPVLIGSIVLLLIIGIVSIAISKNNKKQVADKQSENALAMKKDENEAMQKQTETLSMSDKENSSTEAMTDTKNGSVSQDSTMMMSTSSTYLDYSEEVLAEALKAQQSGRKVVLFFHAKWCEYCVAADKDFKEKIGTDAFPKNITLIKTDYDTQKELKRKYGVTTQHTFVQIDSNGNQITKWISGESADLAKNIK